MIVASGVVHDVNGYDSSLELKTYLQLVAKLSSFKCKYTGLQCIKNNANKWKRHPLIDDIMKCAFFHMLTITLTKAVIKILNF